MSLDNIQDFAARGAAAQAAADIEIAIAMLAKHRASVTPDHAGRLYAALGDAAPVAIDQSVLDDLLEASDRLERRVQALLKPGEEVEDIDIHGAAYAMGQLSGLHLAIHCLEVDDAYMEEEGDEDSPIKFVGISRAYLFEEPGAYYSDLRTTDGKSWERAMGEYWESEFDCDHLTQAFERWRDRVNRVALGHLPGPWESVADV